MSRGYSERCHQHLFFLEDEVSHFHTNGVVSNGRLATATTVKVVDTVSGDTNTFTARWHIFFHTNGVVSSGTLASGENSGCGG